MVRQTAEGQLLITFKHLIMTAGARVQEEVHSLIQMLFTQVNGDPYGPAAVAPTSIGPVWPPV